MYGPVGYQGYESANLPTLRQVCVNVVDRQISPSKGCMAEGLVLIVENVACQLLCMITKLTTEQSRLRMVVADYVCRLPHKRERVAPRSICRVSGQPSNIAIVTQFNSPQHIPPVYSSVSTYRVAPSFKPPTTTNSPLWASSVSTRTMHLQRPYPAPAPSQHQTPNRPCHTPKSTAQWT